MIHNIGTSWSVRTLLSVPGHRSDLIVKASRTEVDGLMLDLQDATPPDKKREARTVVRQALESGALAHKSVVVRINHPGTGLAEDDVYQVACQHLNGFVFPMVNSAEEVLALDRVISERESELGLESGRFSLIALIETPLGVVNAYPISVSTPRMVALLFGAEDFLVKLRGRHDPHGSAVCTPRALIAIAARAAGIEAIDTPFLDLADPRGLWKHADRGRTLGMSGMLIISPRQIPVVHRAYSPTDEEIQAAQEMVTMAEQMREAGESYAVANNRLVSPSKEKEAMATLARAGAFRNRESAGPDRSEPA